MTRALLEQALNQLITRGAQPGYETEQSWLKIVNEIEAYLAKSAQQERKPAWHDKPTVPGRWLGSDYSFATVFKTGGIFIEGVRWYGPIPEDVKP